jgi:hypothetical protein
MTITAKYASKCARCGGQIQVGEKIEWSKGSPAMHSLDDTTCSFRVGAVQMTDDELSKSEETLAKAIDTTDTPEGTALASALLDVVRDEAARRSTPTDSPVRKSTPDPLTPGVYEKGDDIFVVKPNREKTRLYAKRLVEVSLSAPRLLESGDRVDYDIEFEYAKGAIYDLAESDRMPYERAKALSIRYGRCINCGRRLKAADSVERGIGPVCAKAFAIA